MKKATPALLATLLLAPVVQGQTVQTLFSSPGAQAVGVAVDYSDNTFYTLWQGLGVDPVVTYNRYNNATGRSVEAPDSPFIAPASAVAARGGIVVADQGLSQLQWVDRQCGIVSNLCPVAFSAPVAVDADSAGNLYVADANGIYKLNVSNQVTALGSGFSQPGGVAVDDAGRVWVADAGSDVIKLIQINGTNVSTTIVAGKAGTPGFADSSKGGNARFNSPGALCWVGGQTGLLVADYDNNAIRNVVYNVGCDCYSVGTVATGFSGPSAVTVDNEGTIIIADSKAGSVRAIARSAQPNPAILPPSGSYSNAVTAVFSTTLLPGFAPTFRYTLNNTQPTRMSPAGTSATFDGVAGTDAPRLLRMRCFAPDLATSVEVSNAYSFFVNIPVCNPAGVTNNNPSMITLSDATAGATLYWTLDGSEPSPSNGNLYTGPFAVAANGVMNVKGFKPGYNNSVTLSVPISLTVATPVVSPNGAASSNDIPVTISCATTSAQIFYTTDGSDPTPASLLYSGPFMLSNGGVLKAKAFRSGFVDSAVASALFNLTVGTPSVTPAGIRQNSVHVDAATGTVGAVLRYTLDGSVPTDSSPVWTPSVFVTNATLTIAGFKAGYTPSATVVSQYQIQVDAPVVTPPGGYFPEGVMVSLAVQRADAAIYYTLTGIDPTTNDTRYTGPFRVDEVKYPGADLTLIRARAFAPNTVPSGVVSGQSYQTNMIGVDRDIVGGIGSMLVVPVTLTLAGTQEVRSLQFRLEVVPLSPGAPVLDRDIDGLSVLTNDFRPIVLDTTDGKVTEYYVEPYRLNETNGIRYASIATNLRIHGYAVAANFMVPVPATAAVGDQYRVQVVGASATSDAQQNSIPIVSMPPRVLTVTNVSYLVGDSAPGRWYNAGDFGDNVLDNADVNNAMDASLGIRTPYSFSDAFNAMDVYPVDSDGYVGGDGVISFFDWQILLARSVGLETNIWERYWTDGGVLACRRAAAPKALRSANLRTATGNPAAAKSAPTPPGLVWFRNARIESQSLTNVQPGADYSLPVFVTVKPGSSLAGLQFRGSMVPYGVAPVLGQALTFTPVTGIPQPISKADGMDVVCAWPILPSPSFVPALQGSNLLGYIHWKAPAQAVAGQGYRLTFSYCDGLPDMQTQYFLESRPSDAWILSAALKPAAVISDEWIVKFFGNAGNPNADPNADPDGDGVPNWQEYLSGTNPTNAVSHLHFVSYTWQPRAGGVDLKWLSAPGVNYAIECASSLRGSSWTTVTNVTGDGAYQEVTDSSAGGQARFYRIRAAVR